MAIPEESLILLSGVPATGKSTFGRYLARTHGFAHYDLECHPRWLASSRAQGNMGNVSKSLCGPAQTAPQEGGSRLGFPVHCLPIVDELRAQSVSLIWFDGDRSRARSVFQERGGLAFTVFDAQVAAIDAAGYPTPLKCVVVQALSANGAFTDSRTIEQRMFP